MAAFFFKQARFEDNNIQKVAYRFAIMLLHVNYLTTIMQQFSKIIFNYVLKNSTIFIIIELTATISMGNS